MSRWNETHWNLFVASYTWDLCIHGSILLTLCLWISHKHVLLSKCFLFSSNPVSSSCRWASHSHHIHDHTANCTCVFPLRLSVKQYFTSLKPSQDVCFWRVLICILNIPNAGHFVNFWYTYMNDFYFHCHDKDLWSSLLCRLYWWWKMSHIFLFLFLCIILQLFLCCIPPTQCKVLLLLYYYYYRWVDCLETKMQISYGNR